MTVMDRRERAERRQAQKDGVAALEAAGVLDGMYAAIDAGELQMDGPDGFIQRLVKAGLERGLQAELSDHLGYDKGDPTAAEFPNSRNGSYPKTVSTQVGEVELAVPRDRDGSFTPMLVPKGSRRLSQLDEMIISLYAGGMTVRDIEYHLVSTIGVEISRETISKITDEIADEVLAWQSRPLEAFYPVIYLDAIVVKIRDGAHVRNKAAHIAVGVDMDGIKHVLGIWVQAVEGAKFWAGVCAEIANRGVKDVLIVCCDGLTGFPEAVETTWPSSTVQTARPGSGQKPAHRSWSVAAGQAHQLHAPYRRAWHAPRLPAVPALRGQYVPAGWPHPLNLREPDPVPVRHLRRRPDLRPGRFAPRRRPLRRHTGRTSRGRGSH